ncbi:MAG: winged helix-turn-helix domain-containing protein, partial [Anaerolineae bacterium]|nr:winged helix-turn-helix domain-containing protein [Anaerolineae bacterium]
LTYNPARFYGRENEITSILQVITATDPGGHAIYGLRTIGKTTLLKYLKDRNGALKKYANFVNVEYRPGGDKSLLFVYLNFHIFTEGESVFYLMLEQLAEELENEDLTHIVQLPAYADETPRQELVNALRRTLQRLNNQRIRVVFLFDDFDVPLKTLDNHDDGLLRTLSDYAALIIVTEEPISELRPDFGQSSPLLGILRPDSIGLLSEIAARELIHHPLEAADTQYASDEENFLIQTAGRQPFLLTAACELYFETRIEAPGEPDITHAFQVQFRNRLASQLHVMRVLQSTWNRLKPYEHRTLYALYSGSELDLTGDRGNLAARLEKKGLTYRDARNNDYHLFSLLFGEFVQQVYDQGEAKTLIPSILPARPSLEGLTPIETALLRYFTAHADQVCTFEELLDTVWEDGEKSKRALEAAVHRLRKSLQPDEAIKSVRGIGFKFVTPASQRTITQETEKI